MKNIFHSLIIFSVLSLLMACDSEKKIASAESTESAEEMETEEIRWERIHKKTFSDSVVCSGYIEAPPQSIATISSRVAGFIKTVHPLQGSYLRKGAVIAVLEHPDYIHLQQQYLESLSQLGYLEKEYQRQQNLSRSQAGPAKVFEQTEADYTSARTRVGALRQELNMIGIPTDELTADNIRSSITIRAPFSGYVTEIHVNPGKFVGANDPIGMMINKSHLHLELQVFERDMMKVREDQKIHYHLPGASGVYDAEVHLIGQDIDIESRTMRVHGHLIDEESFLKPGMFVNAVILTGEKEMYAVPSAAVFTEDGNSFIWIKDEEGKIRKKAVFISGTSGEETFLEGENWQETTEVAVSGLLLLAS